MMRIAGEFSDYEKIHGCTGTNPRGFAGLIQALLEFFILLSSLTCFPCSPKSFILNL